MSELIHTLLALFKDSTIPLAFIIGVMGLLIWKRRAQPSSLSLILLLGPIPLFLLSMRWAWMVWPAWIYTPILMLLLLIDGLLLTPTAHQLSLKRTVASKLSIGRTSSVELTAINNSSQPLTVEFFDSLPAELLDSSIPDLFGRLNLVPAFSQQTVAYTLKPTLRGSYTFNKIHARYKSRLGLLWMTLQDGRAQTVTVTPDLQRIKQLRIQMSKTTSPGELQKKTLGLEGTQFSGLRHYFAGDDMKKMAWQATAKLDLPVIRTFEHEVEQPVFILLDAGRKMASWTDGLCKYDWALNSALSLSAVALERKDSIGAAVFSNRLLAQVPFGSGQTHWRKLIETLSQTQVQNVEPDYESTFLPLARQLKHRALIVLFTDLIDPVASNNLLRGLKSFSSRHTLIIATLTDAESLELTKSHPQDAYHAYQKGVALDLYALRRQALAALTRTHRAIVIDAPPSQLDERLIQKYCQMKQHSLI